MKNNTKAIKAIFVIPAIVFGFFAFASLFSKTLGVRSFVQELFFTLFYLYFLALPFVFAFIMKNIRGRVFFLLVGLIYSFVLIFVQNTPQNGMVRFYHQTKNHIALESLKCEEVSYIALDNIRLTQPEQVCSIVEALNKSTWYSPNHERKGKEVSMTIVLQNGQEMYFHLRRFYGEDSADLLFLRPRASGFWADGNAYVPRLPSILENMGYSLSWDG